jgi:hypothetical protein
MNVILKTQNPKTEADRTRRLFYKAFFFSRKFFGLLALIALLGVAGCETDSEYVPGRIPKETAIAIAERANKQFPYPLSKVTRAAWRPEQGYWAIDFKDEDENFGKFYLVSGKGKIVGEGRIVDDHYH